MHEEDDVTEELAEAITLLRAEVPVRAEWRAALLRSTAAAPRRARGVTLSIPAAIAAAAVFAVAGAGAARLFTRPGVSAVASHEPVADASVLPVKFSVIAPNAARVSIVGDFNAWNPATLPMRRSADGRGWEVEVRLPLGRYSYAFMIDGQLAPDPSAPRGSDDDFGAPNSVLMVRGS
jgi:hypothetical protein